MPETVERRELVQEQLERILASPVFRNSKRYAAVLRYVVGQTLDGNADQLKERTIGVDVFGREPDYDTASNHVVRSAVAEVRKRLAQYYQEDARRGELRFELLPGSYVPQFRFASVPAIREDTPRVAPGRRRWILAASAAFLAACSVALALGVFGSAHDPAANFWGPVLASPGQVLLCIGNLEGGRGSDAGNREDPRTLSLGDFHRLPSETIHVSDAVAIARFTGFLQARKKPWRIATQSEASFSDLRNGPAILIGLMNNDWTERLVGKLRFRVERSAPRTVVIRDSQNPSRSDWSMDYATPLLSVTKDYALVLRVLDPKTDQMVVTAAGISVFGTLAASEFLTNDGALRSLERLVPGGSKPKNIEIVLSTEVIRAKSGPPKIIAVHVW